MGIFRVVIALLLFTLSAASVFAASEPEILGARAVIEAVSSHKSDEKDEKGLSSLERQRRQFFTDLKEFQAVKSEMPPKEAAKKWLKLLDRFLDLPKPESHYFDYNLEMDVLEKLQVEQASQALSLWSVLSVLPPPDSWKMLSDEIRARPDETPAEKKHNAALRLLSHLLNGELNDAEDAITEMRAALKSADPYIVQQSEYSIHYLEQALQKTIGFENSEAVVKNYRATLKLAGENPEQISEITVPDLARLTTEEEARELLKKTLLTPGLKPRVPSGGKTLALLKTILMEEIENLSAPFWSLVESPDDMELFEAMDRQFSIKAAGEKPRAGSLFISPQHGFGQDRDESERHSALYYYLLGLISKGRVDDAVALVLKEVPSNAMSAYGLTRSIRKMEYSDLAGYLFSFTDRVIVEKPGSPWLYAYVPSALMDHKTDVALKRLSELLGRGDLEISTKMALRDQLAALNLAVDKLDAGIDILRQIIATDRSGLSREDQSRRQEHVTEAISKFFELGRLLDRPELADEAIRGMRAEIDAAEPVSDPYRGALHLQEQLVEHLIEAERYSEAERVMIDEMVNMIRQQKAMSVGQPILLPINLQQPLTALVEIYDATERYEDVRYLLEEVPWWGAEDLGQIGSQDLILSAARALHHTGKSADAVQMLKNFLLQYPQTDAAYELLLKTDTEDLTAWLDMVYTRDRFEERPLIWKAVLLHRRNKLDEAEAAVRQALKVDPTDGETMAGDRVRAYSVLADILSAKGKEKDARFFRSVVRSVRSAEIGDELTNAGLITRSLKRYEEAETDFMDAYCVQWRLAERLHALGRYKEAEKHYAIAFERMPEQFGQVASFCFGCEGVFDGQQSRSVAERILTRLVKEHPDHPQVHFLLGQLREAQNEYALAYSHFKLALEHDPQYLDALERLYYIRNSLFLPKKETDAVAFDALRLDPMQRHFSGGVQEVADLATLWKICEENQKYRVKKNNGVFTLKATRAAMDDTHREALSLMNTPYYTYGSPVNPMRPGLIILQHEVIRPLLELMSI